MMIEVCIRLAILYLTIPKISLDSEVSDSRPDEMFEATATLLGLVPDTIEHATHTVRFVGWSIPRKVTSPSSRASAKSSRNSTIRLQILDA